MAQRSLTLEVWGVHVCVPAYKVCHLYVNQGKISTI